ncbi:MAG: hypothetical protein ACK56I_13975, partial [bacterium]
AGLLVLRPSPLPWIVPLLPRLLRHPLLLCCCWCPYCPPPSSSSCSLCLVWSPSLPTKGQPLKGRVPPGSGLSPLWTPTLAAAPFHMENGDDDDDVKCFILGK